MGTEGEDKLNELLGNKSNTVPGFKVQAFTHTDECADFEKDHLQPYAAELCQGAPAPEPMKLDQSATKKQLDGDVKKTAAMGSSSKTVKKGRDEQKGINEKKGSVPLTSKNKTKSSAKATSDTKQKPSTEPAGPFSDGSKLQVLLEDGWVDCSKEEMLQIGHQLATDTKKFAIQARGGLYIVDCTDPDNWTQTNPATQKSRKLRIVAP